MPGQQRYNHREAACGPGNRDEAAGAGNELGAIGKSMQRADGCANPTAAAKGSRKLAATAVPASAVAAALTHEGMTGTASAHPAIIPTIQAAGSVARSHRP